MLRHPLTGFSCNVVYYLARKGFALLELTDLLSETLELPFAKSQAGN